MDIFNTIDAILSERIKQRSETKELKSGRARNYPWYNEVRYFVDNYVNNVIRDKVSQADYRLTKNKRKEETLWGKAVSAAQVMINYRIFTGTYGSIDEMAVYVLEKLIDPEFFDKYTVGYIIAQSKKTGEKIKTGVGTINENLIINALKKAVYGVQGYYKKEEYAQKYAVDVNDSERPDVSADEVLNKSETGDVVGIAEETRDVVNISYPGGNEAIKMNKSDFNKFLNVYITLLNSLGDVNKHDAIEDALILKLYRWLFNEPSVNIVRNKVLEGVKDPSAMSINEIVANVKPEYVKKLDNMVQGILMALYNYYFEEIDVGVPVTFPNNPEYDFKVPRNVLGLLTRIYDEDFEMSDEMKSYDIVRLKKQMDDIIGRMYADSFMPLNSTQRNKLYEMIKNLDRLDREYDIKTHLSDSIGIPKNISDAFMKLGEYIRTEAIDLNTQSDAFNFVKAAHSILRLTGFDIPKDFSELSHNDVMFIFWLFAPFFGLTEYDIGYMFDVRKYALNAIISRVLKPTDMTKNDLWDKFTRHALDVKQLPMYGTKEPTVAKEIEGSPTLTEKEDIDNYAMLNSGVNTKTADIVFGSINKILKKNPTKPVGDAIKEAINLHDKLIYENRNEYLANKKVRKVRDPNDKLQESLNSYVERALGLIEEQLPNIRRGIYRSADNMIDIGASVERALDYALLEFGLEVPPSVGEIERKKNETEGKRIQLEEGIKDLRKANSMAATRNRKRRAAEYVMENVDEFEKILKLNPKYKLYPNKLDAIMSFIDSKKNAQSITRYNKIMKETDKVFEGDINEQRKLARQNIKFKIPDSPGTNRKAMQNLFKNQAAKAGS